jgi:LPPG:FO 2-phospho-L-lactate transferase
VPATAAGVAAHYGPEFLDGWLVDEQDKAAADEPDLAGITVRARPLYMSSPAATAAIARAALDLAIELRK